MHIRELRLGTPSLAEQLSFYTGVLGLPVLQTTPASLAVQVGASRLILTEAAGPRQGSYHFAFNIPENQYAEAKTWLSRRVPLIADANGVDLFALGNWNVHNIYFYDPAGNVLELIARHDLPNASDRPFGAASLLNISEIGIASDDVPGQAAAIQARVNAPLYRQALDDTFTAIGDEYGLFIVVRRGRIWFPDTGKPAEHLPITLVADDGQHDPVSLRFG
jgi:catechol-2,3-dioxygenase